MGCQDETQAISCCCCCRCCRASYLPWGQMPNRQRVVKCVSSVAFLFCSSVFSLESLKIETNTTRICMSKDLLVLFHSFLWTRTTFVSLTPSLFLYLFPDLAISPARHSYLECNELSTQFFCINIQWLTSQDLCYDFFVESVFGLHILHTYVYYQYNEQMKNNIRSNDCRRCQQEEAKKNKNKF